MKNATPSRIGRLPSRRDPALRILSAALLLVCPPALAADLHVPADYPTIAAAVAAARARTDDSTTILIAPGIYAESGIVLDVPNLTLAGTALPKRGPDGFLTDLGSQTLALVGTNLPVGAFVFQVKAGNVRITGLALEGLHPIPAPPPTAPPGSGGVVIVIDGALSPADGFSIEGNIVMGEGFGQGITSRMASGTIQGNRITLLNNGSAVFGGRPEDAKFVAYRDNIVVGNFNVGTVFQGGNGSRTSSPQAADGPGSISVEVSGNEFRGNGSNQSSFANLGLSFLLNDNTRSDSTQPARIEANVHDNFFVENRNWGIAVAQRVNLNSREIGFEFEGAFEHNRYCGNGLNAAIIDFRQVTTTLGGNVLRYARGSTYVIHAENDPLASIGFDLDHPAYDPDPHDYTNPIEHEDPGVPLGNTLIFNGAIVPTAEAPVLQRTTPMIGCLSPLTMGPQAMEGNLIVHAGDLLKAGYDFTMPGSHPAATVKFVGPQVTFQAACVSGGGGGTIVVGMADQSYDDGQNSSAWLPSGDQKSPLVYPGQTTVPDLCGGGAISLGKGGTFTAGVQSTDHTDKVNIRWHYSANGSAGGWSGTQSVTPN